MKIIELLKNCCKERKQVEKIGLISAFIAILLQIIFIFVIPCGVEKITYHLSYIIANFIMIFFISFIVYLAVVAIYNHITKRIKSQKHSEVYVLVFVISLVLSFIACSVVCCKNGSNELNFAKKTDYDTLYNIAEDLEYDDIKEEAKYAREIDFLKALKRKSNSFSWYKESGKYYVLFKSNKGELNVVYDKNYQIVESEWEDFISASVFMIFIFACCVIFIAVLLSTMIIIVVEEIIKDEKNKMIDK